MERQYLLRRIVSGLLVVATCLVALTATSDIRMPPVITMEPQKNVIFSDDVRLTMSCEATGTPEPEYTWKKNGADLDLNSPYLHAVPSAPGTFEIYPTTRFDEGFYRCVASNQYGTVVSNTSHLQRSVLISDGEKHIKTINAVEGQQLKVEVQLPVCFPPPTITWEIGKEVDVSPRKLVLSQRVQISPGGECVKATFYIYAHRPTRVSVSLNHRHCLVIKSTGTEYKDGSRVRLMTKKSISEEKR